MRIPFSSRPHQHLLLIFFVFLLCHFDRCEVKSHWDFVFHFCDDKRHWASSHVPVGRLYVSFGKISMQVLCTFLNWVVCFVSVALYEFLYILDINPLLNMSFAWKHIFKKYCWDWCQSMYCLCFHTLDFLSFTLQCSSFTGSVSFRYIAEGFSNVCIYPFSDSFPL